jgi:hypothetical protein
MKLRQYQTGAFYVEVGVTAIAGSRRRQRFQLGGGIELAEARRRARRIGKLWLRQCGEWTAAGLLEARAIARGLTKMARGG